MDSDYLFEFAADSYGFNRDTLQFVAVGRDKTRQFYAFVKCDNAYILRIVECCSSLMGQVIAEMDWLCYLAEKGVSVSVPLRACNGDLALLSEENGETQIICAYTRVKGKLWDKNDPKLWNERIFYNWGKVMGDMHRITKDYRPAEGREKRPEFSSIILDTVKAFPSVNRVAEEVLAEIESLPKDRESYGLIHYDLNPSNFMIDGERINVFDFADCAYAWYALDMGCALTVGLWMGRCNDAGYDFTNKIIKHFLSGYLSANALEDFWLTKIPLFMKLCQLAGFSCTYNCVNADDDQQRELIYNIENNIFLTDCTIDYSLFHITNNNNNASRL